ncbi:MAG: protein kinase [Muribaculaceae bacterium]|nr:protein kinase [Muribaculaceae bacterium]
MSQFLNNSEEYSRESAHEIDFDDAIRLPGGGSTCDIYRTRWQRRDVFVKRLKEEFRAKPIYLDALDKEFDIGVKLRHPSLPVYHEFHRDYIVIDFVDGQTLAEMIKRNDAWLANERNIVKILKELIDVVDYLHRHNIVHCDIKPDNIIITANTKNLVLIDFDKSYSDALNDTCGHPGKYGLSVADKGQTAIDFRAIAMVIEKLKANITDFKFSKYKEFVKACYDPDINCETLTELLSEKANRGATFKGIYKILLSIIAIAAIGLLISFLGKFYSEERGDHDGYLSEKIIPEEKPDESVTPNNDVIYQQESPSTPVSRPENHSAERASKIQKNEYAQPNAVTVLNDNLKPFFDELIGGLDRLDMLRSDTTVSRRQLMENWENYVALEGAVIKDSVVLVVTKLFPDITDKRMSILVSATESYKNYLHRANFVKMEFMAEVDRRAEQ